MKENDIVFDILNQMLSASPEASYKRLDPALRSTLSNCIAADLPFRQDTFSRIYNKLRGDWWFGDGGGSHIGEHFYTQACEFNHASAYQSFEAFAGRPGVLWEEDIATPCRLYVGSRFTWKGYYVTVTSMRADSLVACTYKTAPDADQGITVGSKVGAYDKPYVVTSASREGSETTILHVIKASPEAYNREIARRFTIKFDEIIQCRRTAKDRLKKVLEQISKCNPEKDAATLTKRISAEYFRHWELEEVRAAFQRRKNWVANEKRIEAWRTGANGAWLDVKSILLRIKGDLVECSTGTSVSVAVVRRVLPVVMARRREFGAVNLPLDGYTVKNLKEQGVQVGCTLVPWPEVERLETLLTA